MARKRTAADIIRDAITANTFADLLRYDLQYGFRTRPKALYQKIEIGELPLSDVLDFLRSHPDYQDPNHSLPSDDFRNLLGDPRHTPSYEQFRKLARIGAHKLLTQPKACEFLPDSFEAIYQLSFLADEHLVELIEFRVLHKGLTLEAVLKLSFFPRKRHEIFEESLHLERRKQMKEDGTYDMALGRASQLSGPRRAPLKERRERQQKFNEMMKSAFPGYKPRPLPTR